MTAAAFLILARPGVGTQSGSSAPMPLNSLPISCWATSIARPIASASAGVSTPKMVRTAIFCVSAAISRLMSMRSPPDQVSASSTVLPAIVAAYDRTCFGRTDGWTSDRFRRQSGPRATTTPLPITVRNATPSMRLVEGAFRLGEQFAYALRIGYEHAGVGAEAPADHVPVPAQSLEEGQGVLPELRQIPEKRQPLGARYGYVAARLGIDGGAGLRGHERSPLAGGVPGSGTRRHGWTPR